MVNVSIRRSFHGIDSSYDWFRFLWALSAPFLGVYMIAQNISIPASSIFYIMVRRWANLRPFL